MEVIGILRADEDRPDLIEEYGHYHAMFATLFHQIDPTLKFKVYDVPNGEMPQDIYECDGYLIPGSRVGVYESDTETWIEELVELSQRISEAGIPQAGICFGHQLLALAFGGEVTQSEKGWGIGTHCYEMQEDSRHLPKQFCALATHQDQVKTKPAGSTLLATSEFCPVAALKHTKHKFISFQAHPEFTGEFLTTLIERRREDIVAKNGEERYNEALKNMYQPNNALGIAKEILNFFRQNSHKLSARSTGAA